MGRGLGGDPQAMDVEKLTAKLRSPVPERQPLYGCEPSADELVRVQRQLAYAFIEQHRAAA